MMIRSIKSTLAFAATLALALPAIAAAQGSSFTVDEAMAARGKTLWSKNGCAGCHGIGKKLAGPDLAGVYDRRSMEWLRRWLTDTKQMLETDSIAKALLAESKGAKMPQFRLTEADADALVHYIAQESAKRAGK